MKYSPKQLEALDIVSKGAYFPSFVREDDGWHARWRAIAVENDWVDELVRRAAVSPLTEDAEDHPHRTLHDAWLMALKSRTGLVRWDEAECGEFAAALAAWASRLKRVPLRFDLTAADGGFRVECERPRTRAALRSLGEATFTWGKLREMKPLGRRLAVALDRAEAEDFLRRGARKLSEAGYAISGVDLSAPVTAEAEVDADLAGKVGKVELIVRVAGENVTAQDIRFLLDQGSSLVYFRERWIEVDRALLRQALRALEKGLSGRKVSPMMFALGLGHVGALELEEARSRGALGRLVNELRALSRGETAAPPLKPPKGFTGRMRDYQLRGVEWLKAVTSHGFGALLADDMGLGKTVQTIAWLLSCRPRHTLIVAPLTLLANWRHEFAKFAPALRLYVHQGSERHFASGFREAATAADVTLTSYNLLVRDHTLFSEVAWEAAVLDEAQVIKNPDTRSARAMRALTPPLRLALTGTPIENTVADLWSLQEFLNPGLLGERRDFADRFVRPIAQDGHGHAAKRLKRALEPFLLRRLKTDPGVATELGEKREIKEYCALAPAQRAAYETALADFRASGHAQGDVFALLTELKLICDGEGKLLRLFELLEQIFANGESALVFTQYAKIGDWLVRELERRFGRRVPFLHGALSARAREAEIARFNDAPGPSCFLLSLKAGGFGLNLVKATHVIHFDRWWNPAVESQATDRAYRIGQTKSVFVHYFITEGTLEEHIDDMLERKESLKELLVGGSRLFEAISLSSDHNG